MPRITVKKSQISYFCFSLYAKKCFKAPVALGSENLDPPKSMGVLLLNSVQPGFHLGFRLWEQAAKMKAFSSWFMKYIFPCQITGLLLVYVNKDRIRPFCWKPPDCCHLSQTKSLFLTRNMGVTEWIRAVVIPCEVHRYENRYYMAALIKFKPVTADSRKKGECIREERKSSPVFSCTLFFSIPRWTCGK